MTQALNRLRSNKGIFSVPESQIIVNPFDSSAAWPRAFALVVTPTAVAALWGARDPGGTIFLYAEHLLPHPEPCQNARAIQALGGWIPGFLHINGSQGDKPRIARLYRDLGLNIETATPGEDAGVYQLLQLLAANKLKVFASLSGFLAEYRMDDEQSPLLLCCQLLILSRERMRTKPVPVPQPLQRVYSGDRSWMR